MSQNVWKPAFTLLVIFQITQAWELVCYNGSLSNFKSVTYRNAAELITTGYYNISQNGVMYAHGYRGTLETQGTNVIIAALLKRYGSNVCAVDWANEANFGLIPFANFPVVIAAAYVVQRELAEGLKNMWLNGMDPKTVQLIGLSLGAHVIGNAGRTFSVLTNVKFARATGLEPAKPGYDGTNSLNPRIDTTSADFVDMIHTDTGRYGMKTPVGHVDCYANLIEYQETGVQPGCDPVNLIVNPPLTPADACSHRRALDLYVDTLEYECQLLAAQAPNETVWASPGFTPDVTACIGVDINQTLRGLYYMRTNGQSPFGLGQAGLKAS